MLRPVLPRILPLVLLALPASLTITAPVAAQDFSELDRLTDLSANEEGGLDLARQQAARGAYLEALATLERVMAANPRSPGPQLLHAIYLCWVDDRQGGRVELDNMDADRFGQQNIAEARQQCDRPPPQPAGPEPVSIAAPPPPRLQPPAPPPPPAAIAPGTGSTPASTPAPPPPTQQGGKD